MKVILFYFTLCTLFSFAAKAQSVTGVLIDSTNHSALENATIKLSKGSSELASFETISNAEGEFRFNNLIDGKYNLFISSIGYKDFKKSIILNGKPLNLGSLIIQKDEKVLEPVVISGAPPAVRQNGDTLEFAASQYKVNPDATTGDLIRKMPGITVDRDGKVTAEGEEVKKVTVDGRDFFGDDATATLRNLPAEIVKKIQVFDKLSDQAQLTGFDDGNTTKSINIVTKEDMRTGNFGRVFAGYGTGDTYSAGGNVSFFDNNRRISLIGLTNNVNQQNFASTDLLGVTGGGGRRGRRGGGQFNVGQQSGIAKTNAFGINYNDAWSDKIDVSGSYFFNNSNRGNDQTVNRQNFITADSTIFYDENTISSNSNFNNRVNFRLDYKIDSNNTIKFSTGLSFQKNNSLDFVEAENYTDTKNSISKTAYNVEGESRGYNFNSSLVYRHAFAKKGRSISVSIRGSNSKNDGETFTDAENIYFKNSIVKDTTKQLANRKNNTNRYNINMVYTESIGEKGQLRLNYNPSFQKSNADRQTFDFDNSDSKYSLRDSSLSNVFDNTYNTHNTGLTYRRGDRDNMISAGLSYQYSELKSNQIFPKNTAIDKSYQNLLADAYARIKLSAKSNLRITYRNSVDAPSVNQLQNVINNSNQLYYSIGNPDLQQARTNRYVLRYRYSDRETSQSLFASAHISTTNNYISNATYFPSKDSVLTNSVTLHKGSQLSKPVNLDGHLSARSYFTFSMPLKFMKSKMNWNAGFGYSKQPGLINGVQNISNSYSYNLGAVLASNISEYIDFTVSYSADINKVKNTFRPNLNNNYFTQTASITAKLLTKKGLFFQNDISNQSYKGLTDGFNQSYWLWNMAVGQKFLKNNKGELKLSVFDLLKQNKSINRNVTESFVQDVRNQILQQYFMLTFTYKLRNFGKEKPDGEKNDNHFRRGGFHSGPPPPPPM